MNIDLSEFTFYRQLPYMDCVKDPYGTHSAIQLDANLTLIMRKFCDILTDIARDIIGVNGNAYSINRM